MRIIAMTLCLGLVAACSNESGGVVAKAEIAKVAYNAPGPKTLTLMTMVNNRSGSGGHTALLVNGSQQVIFDPAGSFRDPRVFESGDVLYGMSPRWVQGYKSAHARSTYHVVSQEIQVTDAQAEQALRLVMANGQVNGAFCANSTSALLSKVAGFEGIKKTFYPVKLQDQFEALAGVKTTKYYENDEGDVVDAVKAAQSSNQP